MKKSIVWFFLILLVNSVVFSNTVSSNYLISMGGVNGYILAPSALPVDVGTVNLNSSYIFSSQSIALGFAFSLLRNWEIGFYKEIPMGPAVVFDSTPLFISSKFRFITGSVDVAFGTIFSFDMQANPENTMQLYIAFHSSSVFGNGMMDIVLGKTIGISANAVTPQAFNLYIGTLIPLIGDQFLLLTDFSTNTHAESTFMDSFRGIFNIGVVFDIIPKKFSIFLINYEFLELPLQNFGLGFDIKLGF